MVTNIHLFHKDSAMFKNVHSEPTITTAGVMPDAAAAMTADD